MTAALPPLILASGSVYRRDLLSRLQLDFSWQSPDVDETPLPGEKAEVLARRLSVAKARAVSLCSPEALVIGSDQTARLGAQLLGKPGTAAGAREQLARSSGAAVSFFTGVALVRQGVTLDERCVATQVQFRELSAAQIARYVERESPLDCAGSFRWEALGISLFRSITSEDPTALQGLPLIALCGMLPKFGINIL